MLLLLLLLLLQEDCECFQIIVVRSGLSCSSSNNNICRWLGGIYLEVVSPYSKKIIQIHLAYCPSQQLSRPSPAPSSIYYHSKPRQAVLEPFIDGFGDGNGPVYVRRRQGPVAEMRIFLILQNAFQASSTMIFRGSVPGHRFRQLCIVCTVPWRPACAAESSRPFAAEQPGSLWRSRAAKTTTFPSSDAATSWIGALVVLGNLMYPGVIAEAMCLYCRRSSWRHPPDNRYMAV
ncbi:hypothetical protein M432DRAFT_658772 [Thermoascus aurantiacus ATCC 26904]